MSMFDSILVANRGEIALRVMRAARSLGLRCIAVHSDEDADAPHVAFADDAACIGPAPAAQSYLNAEAILRAARRTGAQAIHPGYGFLSENADFARAVEAAGLVFVGPPPEAIALMGDKAAARRRVAEAGVPCLPGYDGPDQSDARLIAEARAIGAPLMVKAAAGGGGRGMRLVRELDALPDALARARAEALAAFGSDALILERAALGARHVEIQIMADAHGATIHLGERDCSVQRRHQKLIEEAPSPALDPELRARMGAAATAAARAAGYRGAGTVEFLLDRGGDFFFLEMNTRLQVEHPVTEAVCGLDLVALQIRVAQGAPLGLAQEDVRLNGHAIEVRLCAEDPAAGFLPSTGPVALWRAPEGVRVDHGVGPRISAHYDSMAAKIIAHGPDRETARRRLIAALERTALLGPATNRGFLIAALRAPLFAQGAATTAFLDEAGVDPAPPLSEEDWALGALAAFLRGRRASRAAMVSDPAGLENWSSAGAAAWTARLRAAEAERALRVSARGAALRVETGAAAFAARIERDEPDGATLRLDERRVRMFHAAQGDALLLALPWRDLRFTRADRAAAAGDQAGPGLVRAPMHGVLTDMAAEPGLEVAQGQRLATLEAMKMQHDIRAPAAGRVKAVHAQAGAQVAAGDPLVEIEEP
nr:biotin carboxylase N-terminal domain-containing protein [Oceanicella actignis]